MNLLQKTLATLLITTTLISTTACGEIEEMENLTSIVASTSSTGINGIAFIYPETSKENYYVSVIGHFDSGENYKMNINTKVRELQSYKSHKDYRITYSVSKEDYLKITKFCSNSISRFSEKELEIIQKILSNYTAVEVVDLKIEDEYLHKEFNNDFRFNEENYIKNLNQSEN